MLGKDLWEIDSASSNLGFSLRHIVVSEIQGRFRSWGGQMIFDPEDVDRSLIRVWIDVASRLRLRGVSRNLELEVATERIWTDASERPRASYLVRGKIDRQAFGLRWNQDLDVGGVVVGDRVELAARVEMVRTAESILVSESRLEGDPVQAP
jgi:polyisoprenoid-binding protein YceI